MPQVAFIIHLKMSVSLKVLGRKILLYKEEIFCLFKYSIVDKTCSIYLHTLAFPWIDSPINSFGTPWSPPRLSGTASCSWEVFQEGQQDLALALNIARAWTTALCYSRPFLPPPHKSAASKSYNPCPLYFIFPINFFFFFLWFI